MRRAVLALLWALVLWNAGAMLAYFGPLPGAVGPLLGILGGAFVFLGGGGQDSIRPDADRAVAPLITDHGPPPAR
jgi:hypothetical protein